MTFSSNPSHIRWETSQRYYSIWLHDDLFGELLAITRAWGSKHSRHGNFKIDTFQSEDARAKALHNIATTRKRRRYEVVEGV